MPKQAFSPGFLAPLKAQGPPTQTFPAHRAWPACSTLPVQGFWPDSACGVQGGDGGGCIGEVQGLKPWGGARGEAKSRNEM